jgi:hypothetical protein
MAINNLRSQLYLLAVIRYSDKTVLASLVLSKEVTVEGVRECVASNANIISGKRYTSQGTSYSISYTQDVHGRVYCIVTSPSYSPRVAFTALDEMISRFSKEQGPRAAGATENSMSRSSRPILEAIANKYADPSSVDKITAVQEKLDVVKSNMKENIQQILQNQESIERIELASVQLKEMASDFKDGAKSLKDKMFWKKWKMRLLIGFLVTAVLVVIIVPIAVASSKSSKKK